MSYKRSTFIIDKKFQIKFSLLVCLFVTLSSLAYPVAIYQIFELFLGKLPESEQGQVALIKDNVLHILIVFQIVYLIGAFSVFIFIGHKIAGPLYKLRRLLRGITDEHRLEKAYFRKGDYFHNLAEEYNQAINAIQMRNDKDIEYIDEVILYLNNLSIVIPSDKKPVLKEIISRLEQTKERFIKTE